MSARAVARTGLPAVVLAGAMLVGLRVRDARRTEELNRGLHELRRPLQALALGADGRGSNGDGNGHAPLDLAICALSDLDHAVNGGRRLSRRRLMRLRPVAEAAVQRWSGVAELAGDSIGFEWRAGAAACVADPDRIAQALDNLLANAFEHGTPPVRVGATVRDRRVRVAVEDQGVRTTGARRGPRARRRRGLGLVSEIAREHGGRVALDRGPQRTVAVLELPLASLPVPVLAGAAPG
jgi:signal transduction histidine kinase